MKRAFDDYQLLAHSGGNSLWEGPDHLLYIETSGVFFAFSERYKRIDYSKIQSITYGRTSTFVWTVVWTAVLLALTLWGLIANRSDSAGLAIFGILAVPLLLIFIVNLVRGPTCICKVQTAVQVLRLRPLRRIRPTMRALARLAELCQGHQGGVAVTQEALLQSTLGGGDGNQVRIPGSAKPPFPGSKLVTIGLLFNLVDGIITICDMFIDSLGFFFIAGMVGMTGYALTVSGLARSFRYTIPGPLKFSLWGLVGTLVMTFITGYIMLITATMQGMSTIKGRDVPIANQGDIWKWMSHASFNELGWVAWLIIGVSTAAIFLALLGLPSALRPPGRVTATPVPTPPPRPSPVPPAMQPPASAPVESVTDSQPPSEV